MSDGPSRPAHLEDPPRLRLLLSDAERRLLDAARELGCEISVLEPGGARVVGPSPPPAVLAARSDSAPWCTTVAGREYLCAAVFHDGEPLCYLVTSPLGIDAGGEGRARGLRTAHYLLRMAETLVVSALRRALATRVHLLHVEEAYCELQLRTQRLEQAIQRMRDSDRIKTHFLSTVSHELRTPLTVIFGALRLLRGGVAGELAPLADQLLRTAEDNAGRLVRMISDILDLSNAAAGRLSGTPEATAALTLLETAQAQWQELARQQEVRLHVDPSEAVALCDPRRIVQALSHLISNALKHSPAGAEVRLSAEPRAGVVRFSVRDAGPGIAPEDVAKLFQRFRQLDSSDSRPLGGTGLGLALARVIIAEHGGVIGVDSQLGHGATFWFELRAAEPPTPQGLTNPTNPMEPAELPVPEPTPTPGDR